MELAALQDEVEALVVQAGSMARSLRNGLTRELKPDGSIVTNADRELEAWLRPELLRLVPGALTWGEEEGHSAPGADGLWLVDPIDGTSNFSFGSPLWGVSVALVVGGELVVGAVALPELGETYSAAIGKGSRVNGKALSPISPGPIRPEELVSHSDGLVSNFPGIRWPGKMRHSGAFVVDAMFVAQQRIRGLIDYKCKLYDIAASLLICSELGADVRYADGASMEIGPLCVDRKVGRPFVIFPAESGFFIPTNG